MAEKQKRSRGKGRPFSPGVSGNPAGRPRLGDARAEKVRQVLSETGPDGIEHGLAILRKMVAQARKGDVKAAVFLFDGAYGKPVQPLSGPDGGPHTIILERRG
jgi:hypothetical protein